MLLNHVQIITSKIASLSIHMHEPAQMHGYAYTYYRLLYSIKKSLENSVSRILFVGCSLTIQC